MFKIDVDDEVMDKFISKSLKDTLDTLKSEYEKVKETGRGWVFSKDGAEDVKQIKKLLKALVRVHNWHSPSSEHLESRNYV